ncbi:hypothetical protein Vadar_004197 [Vaccinium darrowii]|uniref:Uncharacterized protein n=1 Tax=Vaccinium darrowii TaxID=229202 RepID=A0ACB7X7G1_9ERIC|nr:hypothetical protein Vadar_004197 [Vaccinium darrowii]
MASQQEMQPIEPNFQFHFTKLTHNLLIPQHTIGLLLIVIIFSIIFLSACFYFYYHFISHFTHFSSTNNPTATPTTNLTSSSPVPVVSQPLGLDPAAISSLPIFLHRSQPQAIPDNENGSCGSVFRESECSICLGLFEDEEIIKVLPKCQHAYHSECVDKWLSARSSCPLCRASLLDS